MKKYKKIIALLFVAIFITLIKNYLIIKQATNISIPSSKETLKLPKLIIKQDNNIQPIYFVDTVTISSKVYDLNGPYIYVKDASDEEIINNITIDYGQIVIEDNFLKVKAGSSILKQYMLLRYSFNNIEIEEGKLKLNKTYTYNELKNNIELINLEYKIEENNIYVTEGNITDNMILKLYYNQILIDSFNILNTTTDLSNLKIKDKYIIENIITVKEFKKKINTKEELKITDSNNNILTDEDNITTSSTVNINNKTYTFSILGDITGTGNIFIGDISKIYRYYKGNINLEKEYILAADVTYDDKIEINDIAKLYQYYKGKIKTLE